VPRTYSAGPPQMRPCSSSPSSSSSSSSSCGLRGQSSCWHVRDSAP
jgi:hypothetical protein